MDLKQDTKSLYEQLSKLSDPVNNRAIRFRVDSKIPPKNVQNLSKKRLYLIDEIELVPSFGNTLYEFLWSTYPEIVCISSKLVDLFSQAKFTGWDALPIKISDPNQKLHDYYYRFMVTGPSLELEVSRMTLEDRPAPTPTGRPYKVYKGYFFNESKYDGSDFFLIRNSYFVSDRVKEILKKNKIKNILLTPILDIEIDRWIIDNVG